MLTATRDHVLSALEFAGVQRKHVKETQRPLDQYPATPSAFLYFTRAQLKRDGSRVRAHGQPETIAASKALWSGVGTLRLELYLRALPDLERALQGMATWFTEHSLTVDGVPHKFPERELEVNWLDESGVLIAYSGFTIDFPVELGIYRHSTWTPLELEWTTELEV